MFSIKNLFHRFKLYTITVTFSLIRALFWEFTITTKVTLLINTCSVFQGHTATTTGFKNIRFNNAVVDIRSYDLLCNTFAMLFHCNSCCRVVLQKNTKIEYKLSHYTIRYFECVKVSARYSSKSLGFIS